MTVVDRAVFLTTFFVSAFAKGSTSQPLIECIFGKAYGPRDGSGDGTLDVVRARK